NPPTISHSLPGSFPITELARCLRPGHECPSNNGPAFRARLLIQSIRSGSSYLRVEVWVEADGAQPAVQEGTTLPRPNRTAGRTCCSSARPAESAARVPQ